MTLPDETDVAIVGGGQAGLSLSYVLKSRGIPHVVIERERVGYAWSAARWESFCLVTPNWQCRLPGFDYTSGYGGTDPDGFMPRGEIVRYLEAYAASFDPPLVSGTAVTKLAPVPGGFEIGTTGGTVRAAQAVLAIGGYHVPKRPPFAERLPAGIVQLHSNAYRSPAHLPPGDVLVVGTGQSGAQIAEDLHLAGRRVHLCTGSAPRVARRYRGRDVVTWLDRMGHYELPVERHALGTGVRRNANHYVTGRDGGRDIDLRAFAADGMRLYGRLVDVRAATLHFGDDLRANLDRADDVSESIKRSIDAYIARERIEAPAEAPYVPPWQPVAPARALALDETPLAAIVWALGFRSDFGFVEVPIFDGSGYPVHRRGVTSAAGLFVLGLPWLHTWGSGRFSGVGDDATYLGDRIEERSPARLRAG